MRKKRECSVLGRKRTKEIYEKTKLEEVEASNYSVKTFALAT